jgi:hypothetical protein
MPHWNNVPDVAAVVPIAAHQAYLKGREVMDKLRKSDAEKAELGIKEVVSLRK